MAGRRIDVRCVYRAGCAGEEGEEEEGDEADALLAAADMLAYDDGGIGWWPAAKLARALRAERARSAAWSEPSARVAPSGGARPTPLPARAASSFLPHALGAPSPAAGAPHGADSALARQPCAASPERAPKRARAGVPTARSLGSESNSESDYELPPDLELHVPDAIATPSAAGAERRDLHAPPTPSTPAARARECEAAGDDGSTSARRRRRLVRTSAARFAGRSPRSDDARGRAARALAAAAASAVRAAHGHVSEEPRRRVTLHSSAETSSASEALDHSPDEDVHAASVHGAKRPRRAPSPASLPVAAQRAERAAPSGGREGGSREAAAGVFDDGSVRGGRRGAAESNGAGVPRPTLQRARLPAGPRREKAAAFDRPFGARIVAVRGAKDSYTTGHLEHVQPGATFGTFEELHHAGVHRGLVTGIAGNKLIGCLSVVLNGGYGTVDEGEWFVHTGSRGRDFSGNKRTNTVQSTGQTLERGNLWLAISHERQQPVRVVRGYKLRSKFAPASGYRYDGVYYVAEFWTELDEASMCRVFKFKFVRDTALGEAWMLPWHMPCDARVVGAAPQAGSGARAGYGGGDCTSDTDTDDSQADELRARVRRPCRARQPPSSTPRAQLQRASAAERARWPAWMCLNFARIRAGGPRAPGRPFRHFFVFDRASDERAGLARARRAARARSADVWWAEEGEAAEGRSAPSAAHTAAASDGGAPRARPGPAGGTHAGVGASGGHRRRTMRDEWGSGDGDARSGSESDGGGDDGDGGRRAAALACSPPRAAGSPAAAHRWAASGAELAASADGRAARATIDEQRTPLSAACMAARVRPSTFAEHANVASAATGKAGKSGGTTSAAGAGTEDTLPHCGVGAPCDALNDAARQHRVNTPPRAASDGAAEQHGGEALRGAPAAASAAKAPPAVPCAPLTLELRAHVRRVEVRLAETAARSADVSSNLVCHVCQEMDDDEEDGEEGEAGPLACSRCQRVFCRECLCAAFGGGPLAAESVRALATAHGPPSSWACLVCTRECACVDLAFGARAAVHHLPPERRTYALHEAAGWYERAASSPPSPRAHAHEQACTHAADGALGSRAAIVPRSLAGLRWPEPTLPGPWPRARRARHALSRKPALRQLRLHECVTRIASTAAGHRSLPARAGAGSGAADLAHARDAPQAWRDKAAAVAAALAAAGGGGLAGVEGAVPTAGTAAARALWGLRLHNAPPANASSRRTRWKRAEGLAPRRTAIDEATLPRHEAELGALDACAAVERGADNAPADVQPPAPHGELRCPFPREMAALPVLPLSSSVALLPPYQRPFEPPPLSNDGASTESIVHVGDISVETSVAGVTAALPALFSLLGERLAASCAQHASAAQRGGHEDDVHSICALLLHALRDRLPHARAHARARFEARLRVHLGELLDAQPTIDSLARAASAECRARRQAHAPARPFARAPTLAQQPACARAPGGADEAEACAQSSALRLQLLVRWHAARWLCELARSWPHALAEARCAGDGCVRAALTAALRAELDERQALRHARGAESVAAADTIAPPSATGSTSVRVDEDETKAAGGAFARALGGDERGGDDGGGDGRGASCGALFGSLGDGRALALAERLAGELLVLHAHQPGWCRPLGGERAQGAAGEPLGSPARAAEARALGEGSTSSNGSRVLNVWHAVRLLAEADSAASAAEAAGTDGDTVCASGVEGVEGPFWRAFNAAASFPDGAPFGLFRAARRACAMGGRAELAECAAADWAEALWEAAFLIAPLACLDDRGGPTTAARARHCNAPLVKLLLDASQPAHAPTGELQLSARVRALPIELCVCHVRGGGGAAALPAARAHAYAALLLERAASLGRVWAPWHELPLEMWRHAQRQPPCEPGECTHGASFARALGALPLAVLARVLLNRDADGACRADGLSTRARALCTSTLRAAAEAEQFGLGAAAGGRAVELRVACIAHVAHALLNLRAELRFGALSRLLVLAGSRWQPATQPCASTRVPTADLGAASRQRGCVAELSFSVTLIALASACFPAESAQHGKALALGLARLSERAEGAPPATVGVLLDGWHALCVCALAHGGPLVEPLARLHALLCGCVDRLLAQPRPAEGTAVCADAPCSAEAEWRDLLLRGIEQLHSLLPPERALGASAAGSSAGARPIDAQGHVLPIGLYEALPKLCARAAAGELALLPLCTAAARLLNAALDGAQRAPPPARAPAPAGADVRDSVEQAHTGAPIVRDAPAAGAEPASVTMADDDAFDALIAAMDVDVFDSHTSPVAPCRAAPASVAATTGVAGRAVGESAACAGAEEPCAYTRGLLDVVRAIDGPDARWLRDALLVRWRATTGAAPRAASAATPAGGATRALLASNAADELTFLLVGCLARIAALATAHGRTGWDVYRTWFLRSRLFSASSAHVAGSASASAAPAPAPRDMAYRSVPVVFFATAFEWSPCAAATVLEQAGARAELVGVWLGGACAHPPLRGVAALCDALRAAQSTRRLFEGVPRLESESAAACAPVVISVVRAMRCEWEAARHLAAFGGSSADSAECLEAEHGSAICAMPALLSLALAAGADAGRQHLEVCGQVLFHLPHAARRSCLSALHGKMFDHAVLRSAEFGDCALKQLPLALWGLAQLELSSTDVRRRAHEILRLAFEQLARSKDNSLCRKPVLKAVVHALQEPFPGLRERVRELRLVCIHSSLLPAVAASLRTCAELAASRAIGHVRPLRLQRAAETASMAATEASCWAQLLKHVIKTTPPRADSADEADRGARAGWALLGGKLVAALASCAHAPLAIDARLQLHLALLAHIGGLRAEGPVNALAAARVRIGARAPLVPVPPGAPEAEPASGALCVVLGAHSLGDLCWALASVRLVGVNAQGLREMWRVEPVSALPAHSEVSECARALEQACGGTWPAPAYSSLPASEMDEQAAKTLVTVTCSNLFALRALDERHPSARARRVLSHALKALRIAVELHHATLERATPLHEHFMRHSEPLRKYFGATTSA